MAYSCDPCGESLLQLWTNTCSVRAAGTGSGPSDRAEEAGERWVMAYSCCNPYGEPYCSCELRRRSPGGSVPADHREDGRGEGAGPAQQHGLSSNTMAVIASDCDAKAVPEHTMALITSVYAPEGAGPGDEEAAHGRHGHPAGPAERQGAGVDPPPPHIMDYPRTRWP